MPLPQTLSPKDLIDEPLVFIQGDQTVEKACEVGRTGPKLNNSWLISHRFYFLEEYRAW
jgi:hypothetical protein